MAFGKTSYTSADTYAPLDDRLMAAMHYVEGIAPAVGSDPRTACQVVPHSPANLSVDISAGWALVQGDDVVNQGLYASFNSTAANIGLPSGSPPPSSPGTARIDLVGVKINDSDAKVVPAGETANECFPFWVAGSAAAGVTLASPGSSVPATPASMLVLAWVQVDYAATTIAADHIGDKRKPYGPGIWGADGHRYRLAVSSGGTLEVEQVS